MAASLEAHVLYRSAVAEVRQVRCRPRSRLCGGEETVAQHSIAFVRRGCFVKHVHRRTVVADPNQVVFFNRGEPYRVSHPVDGGDDCVSFTLAPQVLCDLLRPSDPAAQEWIDRPFESSHCPSGSGTDLACRILSRALRHGAEPDLAADEVILTLLARVVRPAQGTGSRCRPDTDRVHRDLAAAVQTVLAGRFREPLPLAELSRAVHSSPYHLCRVFHRQTGTTIHRYRTRLRLRAALERLAGGERDTTTLALDLGYSSRGHFSDTFHRELGVAPSAVRRIASMRQLREVSKILGA